MGWHAAQACEPANVALHSTGAHRTMKKIQNAARTRPFYATGVYRLALRAPSQLSHECDQILLFLGRELQLQNNVEKLHSVFEGEQAAVVQIGCAVLDTAKGKCLDRFISWLILQETFCRSCRR